MVHFKSFITFCKVLPHVGANLPTPISVDPSCLRPTFSKCIKIHLGPKKLRHWCCGGGLVIIRPNYGSQLWLDKLGSVLVNGVQWERLADEEDKLLHYEVSRCENSQAGRRFRKQYRYDLGVCVFARAQGLKRITGGRGNRGREFDIYKLEK